jgi:tetratricopeptide (TPR) repeat protein
MLPSVSKGFKPWMNQLHVERKMELQKRAEQSPIARQKQMEQIVDSVFSNEAAALRYPKERVSDLRAKYEDYVSSITGTVHEQVSSIRNEREVFDHLASVFYSNFDYKEGKLVLTGLESKPPEANCYGSSLMFADVMTRLGLEFQVAIVPNHVLLVGKEYLFETTYEEGDVLRHAKDISKVYPNHSIGGLDFLLAASYDSAGLHLMDEKRNEEAVDFFKKALAINPKNAHIQYNLGLLYWREEKYDSAIASFKSALVLDGNNGNIHYGLGISYYGKGDYKKAISYYEASLKKKKTVPNETIYDGMAKAYEMTGDDASAKKYYRMAGSKNQ